MDQSTDTELELELELVTPSVENITQTLTIHASFNEKNSTD
jgi:hypothetical protein